MKHCPAEDRNGKFRDTAGEVWVKTCYDGREEVTHWKWDFLSSLMNSGCPMGIQCIDEYDWSKPMERLTTEEKINPRNSLLPEEARRKKGVMRENQRKAAPIHGRCRWRGSGGGVPRGWWGGAGDRCLYSCMYTCSTDSNRFISFLII